MRFSVLFNAAMVVVALFLSACATSPNGGPSSQDGNSATTPVDDVSATPVGAAPSQSTLGVIATDLVSSLVQLSELSPFSTTIQVNKPVSDFGNELRRTNCAG